MDEMKKGGLFDGGGSEWDESEHPRDDDGKFTEKGQNRTKLNKNNGANLTKEGKGSKIKSQMIKGAKKRVLEYAAKEDGTYDPATGKIVEYEDGFQFSFVRPESFNKLSDEDWDILTAHIMEQTGSKEHIGVYQGAAETSFRVESKEQAIKYMHLFNQDSILIWAMKQRYPNNPSEWFYENNEQLDTEVDYDEIMRKI